jgi:rare lipoprotein A (peptidoglycan hydrolase)
MGKTKNIIMYVVLLVAPLVSQGKSGEKCAAAKKDVPSKFSSEMSDISKFIKQPQIPGYNSCKGKQKGVASVYGLHGRDNFAGKRTASGEVMRPSKLRAAILKSASRQYPMGSWVRVSTGDRSVVVCINDKGGGKRGRVIDLSAAASKELGGDDLTHVEVECLVKPADGGGRCDDKVGTLISNNDM